MEIFLGFLGAGFGLFLMLIALVLVLPLYGAAGIFVNKPNGLMKSGFHIFTTLEPGNVKIIVRGKKLVRMVMNTPGLRFARDGEPDSPEHWELVDADGFTENPVADVWLPLRGWAQLVYNSTGLVFTGLYPFQRVREYELERTKVSRKETRDDEKKGDGSASNIVLTVMHDLSDHFRTREFLYPMHITGAETADKIPLDIIGVAEMRVTNPHKAAFGTDRWDQKVINLVTDAITGTTKATPLDDALTYTSPEHGVSERKDVRLIESAVMRIEGDTEVCGVEIDGFKILEINPVLDTEGLKAIQAEAIAKQKAKATRIDGKARADALRELNEANVVGGDHSVATMEAEALVRAAEAVSKGGGTVFLSPGSNRGSGGDAMSGAILRELQKLNERKGDEK